MILPAPRYFSSQFDGTCLLSVKSPPSQKFLSECLQRTTEATSTSLPSSWCHNSCAGVKNVEARAHWRQCFSHFLSSSRSVSWLLHFCCQHSTLYTPIQQIWNCLKSNQCLNCDGAKNMNAMKKVKSCEKVLIFVKNSQFEWTSYDHLWRGEKNWKISGF